jgi:hypothetical protein
MQSNFHYRFEKTRLWDSIHNKIILTIIYNLYAAYLETYIFNFIKPSKAWPP